MCQQQPQGAAKRGSRQQQRVQRAAESHGQQAEAAAAYLQQLRAPAPPTLLAAASRPLPLLLLLQLPGAGEKRQGHAEEGVGLERLAARQQPPPSLPAQAQSGAAGGWAQGKSAGLS